MRRPPDPFRRPVRDLVLGPRVLVACEGKRTEPGYLDGIRIGQRLSERQVVILPHEGTDPVTVVHSVAQHRTVLRKERRWNDELDTAWAVFDDDDCQALRPDQWNDAVQRAGAWNIRLVVSNPCFELWYLLHFQHQTAGLTRPMVVQMLKQHLPEYRKSSLLYPILRESTRTAIDRARSLADRAGREVLGPFPNPSTNVGDLVGHLLTPRSGP